MSRPLLILVEGSNDAEFLMRLTCRLRHDLPSLPNLAKWQKIGRVVVVPVGGGNSATWPDRLRPLGLTEFHLYDREQSPETAVREKAIARINVREGCRGALTEKRSLENYLHPQCIAAAGGGELEFGDHDAVGHLVAQCWHEREQSAVPWNSLSRRTQQRSITRVKRWLNTIAVEHMTVALLAERDPNGEVLGWLRSIEELAEHGEPLVTSRRR